jgi:hypothetical protein
MAGEKTTAYANGILLSIFNGDFSNAAISSLLANASVTPLTVLYLSLHASDPTASGSQNSVEVSYSGYARISVARTSAGFTVAGNAVTLTSTVNFPKCTGGSATAAYFGIGTDPSGAGHLLYAGPITPSITISNQVTPELTTGTTITEV